jgi:hypothetical protein
MQENSPHYDDQEKLREENEFLKMKIMLQHGAEFGINRSEDLPPEVEHHFLKNVLAFEKQYQEGKQIKIFDKIERPVHFKPVAEIPDDAIVQAWDELREYMNKYCVDLDACSPNVTSRELYRFTTEELFQHETDDINMPGWVTHFIYDEFYPDPVYDSTQLAIRECIDYIFRKDPVEWMHNYKDGETRLNDHAALSQEDLKKILNRFKDCYDEIELISNEDISCIVKENLSTVKGKFDAKATIGNENIALEGSWKIQLEKEEESGYWSIYDVQLEGVNI